MLEQPREGNKKPQLAWLGGGGGAALFCRFSIPSFEKSRFVTLFPFSCTPATQACQAPSRTLCSNAKRLLIGE